MLGVFGNIGGAVGQTASAATWQGVLPKKLTEYLSASELANLLAIYEYTTTQLSYAIGSPARVEAQHACGDAQKTILIADTAIWAIGIVAVVVWRDIRVIGIQTD